MVSLHFKLHLNTNKKCQFLQFGLFQVWFYYNQLTLMLVCSIWFYSINTNFVRFVLFPSIKPGPEKSQTTIFTIKTQSPKSQYKLSFIAHIHTVVSQQSRSQPICHHSKTKLAFKLICIILSNLQVGKLLRCSRDVCWLDCRGVCLVEKY